MSFTRSAARNLVPLLGRIVLAAAFIPVGWDKIMGEEQVFTGQDAEILQRLGVGGPAEGGEALSRATGQVLASYQVETGSLIDRRRPSSPPQPSPAPPPPQAQAEPQEEETVETPLTSPGDEGGAEAPAATVAPSPAPIPSQIEDVEPVVGGVKARRLHRITIMLDGRWPEKLKPQWMAWAAAGTELVGGTFIAVGLFGRLCGLGLAITMGFAFYLTSIAAIGEYGFLALPVEDFNRVFCQIGLFALAFGILLTGAGGVSVDRALFRSEGDIDEEHLLNLG